MFSSLDRKFIEASWSSAGFSEKERKYILATVPVQCPPEFHKPMATSRFSISGRVITDETFLSQWLSINGPYVNPSSTPTLSVQFTSHSEPTILSQVGMSLNPCHQPTETQAFAPDHSISSSSVMITSSHSQSHPTPSPAMPPPPTTPIPTIPLPTLEKLFIFRIQSPLHPLFHPSSVYERNPVYLFSE